MNELDVKKCEFDSLESCYHLTRGVHEESISKEGLGADIGIRSKDGIGNEKTAKVFFTKSLEGTLIFLNRNFNLFRRAAKYNNITGIKRALRDDSPELYERIFTDRVHDDMAEEELDDVAVALGKIYLERGIYYKLDLKHCTKEEFQEMSESERDEIDYFSNDINEERPDEHPTINNMHTRTGRGVKPTQMSLITTHGSKSALDVVVSMSEFYKKLYPEKSLPVLEYKDGLKDKPLLKMLVTRMQEKITQKLIQESIKEVSDLAILDDIEKEKARQQRTLVEEREGQNIGDL